MSLLDLDSNVFTCQVECVIAEFEVDTVFDMVVWMTPLVMNLTKLLENQNNMSWYIECHLFT